MLLPNFSPIRAVIKLGFAITRYHLIVDYNFRDRKEEYGGNHSVGDGSCIWQHLGEGMAIFLGSLKGVHVGINLALAIALHNIPKALYTGLGPVISFNLKRPDGSSVCHREVEKLASLSGI
ncbi:hypothetical protein L2E82_02611 [Cichorium intybus]|uniref:Uncharacterized protein n=1 Tax=Cichorium intybus TaxID=13427 RepID=A0ACB9H4A4_CICIN|nr:hypothetical protein L2E82_02611 [Cichorium intybus]